MPLLPRRCPVAVDLATIPTLPFGSDGEGEGMTRAAVAQGSAERSPESSRQRGEGLLPHRHHAGHVRCRVAEVVQHPGLDGS